jgi:hypothetical protein
MRHRFDARAARLSSASTLPSLRSARPAALGFEAHAIDEPPARVTQLGDAPEARPIDVERMAKQPAQGSDPA